MIICKSIDELNAVTGNKVIGAENINMQNSEIRFNGTGNILVAEKGVSLHNSKIIFSGSNSIVYLSSNNHKYLLNLNVYNNCTCHMGVNNYINGTLNIIVSEQKSVFIGDENLFSFGMWIRTADPHIVYNSETKKRINPSKSVYIGDHVWLGQNAFLLKGAQICSGSILGAGAVCPGKKIGSNESWAGNPARKISGGIFWDGSCVHAYTDEETAAHNTFDSDKYIFTYSHTEYVSFDSVDEKLSSLKDPEKRLEYLIQLRDSRTKNRFAAAGDVPAKRGLFKR